MNLTQVWHKSVRKCKLSIRSPLKKSALDVIKLHASIQIIGSDFCFICRNDFIKELIFEYVPSLYLDITKLLGNNRLGIKVLLTDEFHFSQLSSNSNTYLSTDNIRQDKNFDNFISDSKNIKLFEIAQEIAQNPGVDEFNPFFIQGPPRTGRTHILWAIANRIKATKPNLSVMYIHGEKLIRLHAEYIFKSESLKTTQIFEEYILKNDVLIIDDIQCLYKADGDKEMLFKIMHSYIGKTKKQLIVASTEDPRNYKRSPVNMLSKQ